MRAMNKRAVLDFLRRCGPATRPQAVVDTGLSKPTVGFVLKALEAAGLVRSAGTVTTLAGRTAPLYEADPGAGYVLGIDIGRHYIRAAVSDLGRTVVARRDEPNRAFSGGELVAVVARIAADTIAGAGLTAAEIMVRVIGSPGVVDPVNRCFRHTPNLPGWDRAGLLDELEAAFGAEVLVENDANLAAVGEWESGAARGTSVFGCLTVGTDSGLGLMVNGRVFRGATGAAGEINYLPYEEDRPLHQRLAYTVASVAAVIDPELIVLAGGSDGELLESVERSLRSLTPYQPTVVEGELGADGVLVGAISVGVRAAEDLVFERWVAEN
ncbi:ROK family protein [Amycolatopsis sp. NPDC059657]|uniref:ROK family transcriptional regulator n=1 Tax=Amycolatopsis sp. NPDC059657 TaxID=3346899 RepID=UPI00366AFE85